MSKLNKTNKVFSNKLPWKLYPFFSEEFQRKLLFKKINLDKNSFNIPITPNSTDSILVITDFLTEPTQNELKIITDIYSKHPNLRVLISDQLKDTYTQMNQNRITRIKSSDFLIGEPYFQFLIQDILSFSPQIIINFGNFNSLVHELFLAKINAPYRIAINAPNESDLFNLNLKSPSVKSDFLFQYLKFKS